MFDLAGQMNHFQNQDLDVHRKIANLGEKTFRWEQGSEAHEVKFNYTLNTAATQLLQIFEGLARQQELVELLERRMKYDRLGINDALLQFETDLNKNMLPEPQRALARARPDFGESSVCGDRTTKGAHFGGADSSRQVPRAEFKSSPPTGFLTCNRVFVCSGGIHLRPATCSTEPLGMSLRTRTGRTLYTGSCRA